MIIPLHTLSLTSIRMSVFIVIFPLCTLHHTNYTRQIRFFIVLARESWWLNFATRVRGNRLEILMRIVKRAITFVICGSYFFYFLCFMFCSLKFKTFCITSLLFYIKASKISTSFHNTHNQPPPPSPPLRNNHHRRYQSVFISICSGYIASYSYTWYVEWRTA